MENRQKLVVILSRFPYPLEKGDKLRAYNHIKELSSHFEITLVCVSEKKPTKDHLIELYKFCTDIDFHVIPKWRSWISCLLALFTGKPLQIAYFYTPKIARKIEEKLRKVQPKHIFCQLIRVSDYVKNYHHCPKTLDYMDAFSTGIERRIALASFYLKWLFKLEHQRLKDYELRIYDYFEVHSIISEQDKNLIGINPTQELLCIPNGVSTKFLTKERSDPTEYDLVFVGNLNYPPNVEAVKFVVNELMPLALKSGIQFTFLAAGAEPAKSLFNLALKNENFKLMANPIDIREAYLKGAIFVAPMKIGTGLQNKLLESMALGIPSVTTNLAKNALNALPDRDILIAETAQEFIDQILTLKDEHKYKILSENGRKFIAENFLWSAVTKPLIQAMKNI